MSACSGASGSPLGCGMRSMSLSISSSTPSPGLAGDHERVVGRNADDLFDFLDDARGIGGRQVDLVDDRHHLEPELGGGVAVGDALRFDALRGVDDQQRAVAGRERTRHFVGEVDVPGRVDEVQLVGLAVLFRLVIKSDRLRLDGDAALALELERIEHLILHFAGFEAAANLDEPVRQRGLAVIDVRDDRKITYAFHQGKVGLPPNLGGANAHPCAGKKLARKYSRRAADQPQKFFGIQRVMANNAAIQQ